MMKSSVMVGLRSSRPGIGPLKAPKRPHLSHGEAVAVGQKQLVGRRRGLRDEAAAPVAEGSHDVSGIPVPAENPLAVEAAYGFAARGEKPRAPRSEERRVGKEWVSTC